MLQTNDIYLVRRKADNTFEELGESPFQYTGDPADSSATGNEFSIKTKLRVPELLVEGTHTILDTDTQTSEQLLITNDGTGPAVVINQKGQEAILDIQDDDASVLYIRGDNPYGGNVGIGMGRGPIFSSSNFTEGKTYTVASINDGVGGADTDFTVFGSPSNTIGEVFTVNAGAQGGTGTANLTILPTEQLQLTKNMLLANDTSIFFQDSSGNYGIGPLSNNPSDDNGATISYSADNRLLISNPETPGIEIKSVTNNAAWGTDVQFKVTPNAGITMGKVSRAYTNSTSHVEISGDDKYNLLLTDRTENIEAKLNINATTEALDIGTTTAHSLTLGTRNVAFFTLDQYGHAFLQQNDPGSGLTGGNLTIDGQLSLGGDMLSIAGEEVLYSDYIHVTDEPKEYKILEFTYPTEIDDDNELTGDEGSAFIIEVWSDYQNAGEYVKYSLCHTFLDTANDGSDAGAATLDAAGSRDYALKILESHSVPNSGSFRVRLPSAGDGDISDSTVNIGSYDVAALPVYLDLKNYAGVRVKITSLSSGNTRIAHGVNWSDSNEYRFWSAPTGVTITDWNTNTPNTEPGDALFADTFYGSRNVNWLGTESGYSPYYLKPADTGTSMVVAGNVGIGTASPEHLLELNKNGGDVDLAFHDAGAIKYTMGIKDGSQSFQIAEGGVLSPSNPTAISATRFLIDTNGNVGIGTDNPISVLEVRGRQDWDVSASNLAESVTKSALRVRGSFDSSDSLFFGTSTTAANPYIQATNGVGTNASKHMLLQPWGGNVGIGTDNPDKKLEVFNGALKFGTNTAGLNEFEIFPTDEGDNGLGFYDRSNTAYRMIISNAGHVGIGTTSPDYPLDVSGYARATRMHIDNDYSIQYFRKTDSSHLGWLLMRDDDTSQLAFPKDQDIHILHQGDYDGTGNNSSKKRITIDVDGNVGIGATIPAAQLHIKNTATEDTGIIIENTNNAQNLDIDFYNNQSTAQGRIRYQEGAGSFEINPNVSGASPFTITYGGNVGIGTPRTNPSANLEIKGGSEPLSIFDANDEKKLRVFTATNGAVLALTDGGTDTIVLDGRIGSPNDTYFNSGNVGIGTTSPGATLDVNGSINARGFPDPGNYDHLGTTGDCFDLCYSSPTKQEYSKIITFDQTTGGLYYFHLAFLPGNYGMHYKLTLTGGRYDTAGATSRTHNKGSLIDESYIYYESDGEQGNDAPDTYRDTLMEASTGYLHLGTVDSYLADDIDHTGPAAGGTSSYNYAIVRYPITLPGGAAIVGANPEAKIAVHLEVYSLFPVPINTPPRFKFVSGP